MRLISPSLFMVAALAGAVATPAFADEPSPLAKQKDEDKKGEDEPKRIDINRATVRELCTLPGIGKKRAESIIAYRERRPFTRLSQLLRIRGIGKRTLVRLRPMLFVDTVSKRKKKRRPCMHKAAEQKRKKSVRAKKPAEVLTEVPPEIAHSSAIGSAHPSAIGSAHPSAIGSAHPSAIGSAH